MGRWVILYPNHFEKVKHKINGKETAFFLKNYIFGRCFLLVDTVSPLTLLLQLYISTVLLKK